MFPLVCLGLLLSCKDEMIPLPPEPDVQPSVAVEAGRVTSTSLSVYVTPSDALSCAVTIVKAGATEPSAAEILAHGKSVDVTKPQSEVKFSDLESATEYVILAAASNDAGTSPVERISMKTGEADDPEIPEGPEIPDADFRMKGTSAYGLYYGEWGVAHNYGITVTDVVFDDYGYATGAGLAITLDLYGSATESPMNAVLPAGTYTVDPEGMDEEGSVSLTSEFSRCTFIDDEGRESGTELITDGYVTVDYVAGRYTMVGKFMLADGQSVAFVYVGEMDLTNMSGVLGCDYHVDADRITTAVYLGDSEGEGLDNFYLQIGDGYLENGWVSEEGFVFTLDMFAPRRSGSGELRLPEGDYVWGEYGEFSLGDYYSYGAYHLPSMQMEIYWESGVVHVTHTAGGYRLEGSFVLYDGYELSFTYEGAIDWATQEPVQVGEVLDAAFDRGEGVYSILESGFESYYLTFVEQATGVRARIQLFDNISADTDDPVITPGVYTAVPTEEQAAPQTFALGTMYAGFWYDGSWCRRKNPESGLEGEAAVTGGTIGITSDQKDYYRVELDLTTTDGAFTGVYDGFLQLYSGEIPEPVGDLDITFDHILRAWDFGEQQNGAVRYYAELADVPFEGVNRPADGGAGHSVIWDFYAEAGAQRLMPGTYQLSNSKTPGTCSMQQTFIRVFDKFGERTDVTFERGEITVAESGDGAYHIVMDMYSAREEHIVARYDGAIDFVATRASAVAAPVSHKGLAPAPQSGLTQRWKPIERVAAPDKQALSGRGRVTADGGPGRYHRGMPPRQRQ